MPWVLDTTAQELKTKYKTLYPTANTSDQRLFAMGYDAYHLLFNLNKLSKVPNLQFVGLTGELRLENNILYRRLPRAQISQNSIRVVGQVTQP
jgi:outer membrane PBP1 activator LpoA protein